MKKYAVIVAGGSGSRMGSIVPKQFLMLAGKPVLQHTIVAFSTAFPDINIILVLAAEYLQKGHELVSTNNDAHHLQVAEGGTTRFQSVRNGLAFVTEPSVVFVHDGVRCLISTQLIHRCYEQALQKGSAIPAVTATDSIRMVDHDHHYIANRNNVRIIQTPQTFQSAILIPAFEQAEAPAFTDEASVVEAMGTPVFLCDGEYDNIKITRPVDLFIAERMLEQRSLL